MFLGSRYEKKNNLGVAALPWTHQLTHYYIVGQVCIALEQAKVFELMASGQAISLHELARKSALDETLLNTCLNFLWSTTNLFDKQGDHFILRIPELSSILWGFIAYKPVFDNLGKMLNGSLEYGKDIVRDGYFLQKGSEVVTRQAINQILELLKDDTGITLVDFGCGSAWSRFYFFFLGKNSLSHGVIAFQKINHSFF
jgi:hypothetical protein